MQAQMKFDRCATRLLMHFPFFGSLLMGLVVKETQAINTMATEGIHIFYNPQYVEGQKEEILCTDQAHECGHKAFLHHLRRGNRDPKLWMIACDYTINAFLKSSGLKLGDDYLYDEKYEGMDAEVIYDHLVQHPEEVPENAEGCGGLMDHPSVGKQKQQQPNGSNKKSKPKQKSKSGESKPDKNGKDEADGNGGDEKHADSEGQGNPNEGGEGDDSDDGEGNGNGGEADGSDAPQSSAGASAATSGSESDVLMSVAQARAFAKGCGKMPGDLDRFVEELVNPKVSWEQLLQQFMERCIQDDFTWESPDRRFQYLDMYLPSTDSEGVGEFVIVVDTSGSIDQNVLNQFGSEINKITSILKINKLHVIYCDDAVQRVDVYSRSEMPIKLEARGGGGTSFRPPFHYLEDEGIMPKGLIYLTDLICHEFPEAPQFPMVWAVYGSRNNAPFGEVVKIEN